MRLIDADKTKKEITNYLEKCVDNGKVKIDVTELQICIFNIINKMPTAFDISKVAKQLKEAETDVSSKGDYAIYADDAIKILAMGGVNHETIH